MTGPDPGPQVRSTQLVDLDLDLRGPGPNGPVQVRSRSDPGPHTMILIVHKIYLKNVKKI